MISFFWNALATICMYVRVPRCVDDFVTNMAEKYCTGKDRDEPVKVIVDMFEPAGIHGRLWIDINDEWFFEPDSSQSIHVTVEYSDAEILTGNQDGSKAIVELKWHDSSRYGKQQFAHIISVL